jgi:hypothetical protein
MCSTDILKPLSGLILYTFINNVEHRLTVNIEYINNNGIVKIDIIPQIKLETARGSTIFLVLLIVFR